MLVTITILVILLLAFGSILTSSQRAVSASQEVMKGNNAVAAAASLLREDLFNLAPDGFLAVQRTGSIDRIVFTTVGTYKSMVSTSPPVANSALIDYQVSGDDVLCRRAFLLIPGFAGSEVDCLDRYLAYYKLLDPNELVNHLDNDIGAPNPPVNPNSWGDIKALWPFVAHPCEQFDVAWTPSLIDPDDPNNAGEWYSCPADETRLWPGEEHDGGPYYEGEYVEDNGSYFMCRVPSTTAATSVTTDWLPVDKFPQALRIRFRIGDTPAAETFELIVRLGKN